MARITPVTDYVREMRKKRTVKTRDRYNITDREAQALDYDLPRNSAAHDWGFSPRMMDALIDRHRNGNAAMKRAIEEQLDDINYHPEAHALSQGDYKAALKRNKQYHKEMGTRPTKRYQKQYGMIAG